MAVLRPSRILTLGLGVFDQVAGIAENEVTGNGGRRIAASGIASGVPVLGIIHPTGARVSTMDWQRVTEWLAVEFVGRTNAPKSPDATPSIVYSETPSSVPAQGPRNRSRQPPFKPDTVVRAARKPPSSYAYQPVHDFWHELARMGDVSVADFLAHMIAAGWRRPQGKPLTYDVARTDIACMCREGFAVRVRG